MCPTEFVQKARKIKYWSQPDCLELLKLTQKKFNRNQYSWIKVEISLRKVRKIDSPDIIAAKN